AIDRRGHIDRIALLPAADRSESQAFAGRQIEAVGLTFPLDGYAVHGPSGKTFNQPAFYFSDNPGVRRVRRCRHKRQKVATKTCDERSLVSFAIERCIEETLHETLGLHSRQRGACG